MFRKSYRISDTFKTADYLGQKAELAFESDKLKLGTPSFTPSMLQQHYAAQSKRYPIQAFTDMYTHDPIQEYSRSKDELDKLRTKALKIAQLTQKLYNLTVLEEIRVSRSLSVEGLVLLW